MKAQRSIRDLSCWKAGILVLVAAVSSLGLLACSLVPRAAEPEVVVEPPRKTQMDPAALEAARYHHGLMLLEEGKWKEARVILEQLLQSGEPCALCPRAYFYLGLVDLLETRSPDELEKHRDYMRAYGQKYPGGPCRRNAERIAELLDAQIKGLHRESEKARRLQHKLQAQEKEIETLKFQIQELERIHEETEKIPETLDLRQNR